MKPFRNDVSPGRSDVRFPQIMEKLLGYFCPLLVELKGIQVPFIPEWLGYATREGAWACASFNDSRSRDDVQPEDDCGVVHGVEDLGFAGEGLGD